MELCRLIFMCGFLLGYGLCYDFRLPNDTVPVAYDLKIIPSFGNNLFTGIVNITFNVVTSTRKIVLHARNLTIDIKNINVVSLDELIPGTATVNSTEVDETNALFIINTVNELNVQQYAVSINYTGIIHEELGGFSVATYNVNGTTKNIGLTHFEPTHARSVFPCYDEPRYRTNFTLQITVPNTYSVISNVPVNNKAAISNETQAFYFQGYTQIPTYLLAWVIYDTETYFNVTSSASGIPFNTWARQGFIDQAAYANAYSGTLLSALWSYLNTPSASTKIDQVTIPNLFINARENLGLINYAEESLLYKNGVTTTRDLQKIILTVSHELAHQWFGDLVTLDSWSYPWIKEGFAQYFQYNITASVQPSWQLSDQIVVDLIQPALELDSTPQHALNNYSISSEKEILLMFDDITYNKGAGIIRMLQNVLGEAAFNLGLRVHFRNSKTGVTNPQSFWNNMKLAASRVDLGGASLDKVMTGWTDIPGHPVLAVMKTESGVYNITQKRFLYSGAVESSWWLPLTFTTQAAKGAVTKVFLPGNDVLLANISGNGWILFNVNQTGFYRVNYDDNNWQLLSNQLQSDLTQIPRINRAQLLDDLFNFARGGFMPYTQVLNFAKFLQKEVDYIPWVTAFRNFDFLLKRFYLQSGSKLLKEHILGLMQNVISNVGFQESTSEGHFQKLKRILVLEQACSLGHAGCVNSAAQALKDWKNGVQSTSADIQSALLCAAVQNGNSADWDFVFSKYVASTVPTQKVALLAALTCSQNASKLSEFLDSIITNNSVVSYKEFTAVMKSLSTKSRGAVILLDYLISREYDYEEEVLVVIFKQLAPQLSTLEDFKKLDNYAVNGSCLLNSTTKTIQSLAAEGYTTIQWQEQYYSTVNNWLVQQQPFEPVQTTPSTPSGNQTTSGQSPLTVQLLNVIFCVFTLVYICYH